MGFRLRRAPSLGARRDAYPYQVDAVRAISASPYAAIFHEQGLGKTKIAIDLMLLWIRNDVVDTIFVITKKTLVRNWVEELAIHSHITPRVLSDNRRDNSIALNSPVLIYVLNYEVVAANVDLIRDFLRTCRVGAVLDESQKIKNPEARLTACFHSIADDFSRRVIMTGTPSANRPYDIWSQIKFLDGGQSLGSSYSRFREEYDLPAGPGAASLNAYARRLAEIMDNIRSFSVRETKQTAGIELPDKIIQTHLVALAPRQEAMYRSYRDLLALELQVEERGITDDAEAVLKRLLRLVQCASNPWLIDKSYTELPGKFPKLAALLEAISREGSKAIVWTRFVDNVDWLAGKFSKYSPEKAHGRMPIEDRNESIRRFKTAKNRRLLIATPGSAKEGLTLTAANHAIFYDRGFGLDDYLQAQDRIHRISQDRECFVHNIMASDTIDEWVDALLNAKHQAALLAQGDASRREFEDNFPNDLPKVLTEILKPGRKGTVAV